MRPAARPLSLLVLAAAALRLVIAWTPLDWQLGHNLCDDAFYYLTIARTYAHSGIPSFDGLAPTNGFHPLWMLVITPVYKVVSDDVAAIHAILTIAAALDTLAIVILARILRHLSIAPRIQIPVIALYAFSPSIVTHAGVLNGLETPLNLLLLFLLLDSYLAMRRRRAVWYASPFVMGFCCALAILVRTDNTFLVAVLLATVAITSSRRHAAGWLWSTAITLLFVAPWLLWTIAQFGTMFQVSGEAFSIPARELLGVSTWTVWDYVWRFVRNCADILRFFPVQLGTQTKLSVEYSLVAASLCASAIGLLAALRRDRTIARSLLHRRLSLMCAPIAGGILFVAAHTVKSITLRGWYYASLLPVLFVVLAIWGEYVSRRVHDSRTRTAFVMSLAPLAIAALLTVVTFLGPLEGERNKFAAVRVMEETIPEGEPVGSWNAGVYGYFYRRGPVCNLDGVVNNEAFQHLIARSLGVYCRNRKIRHLVDTPGALQLWDSRWASAPGKLLGGITPLRRVGTGSAAILIGRIQEESKP
jgi:hypothetical protein